MLSELRKQMQQLLAQVPASRKAALRRTDAPDALLATDLPLLAEEDDLTAFVAVVMAHGWRVAFAPNGWMKLDHDIPVPGVTVPEGVAGEAGCCISLLQRHPGNEVDAVRLRALVKADDAGKKELDKLCRAWHREFAEMLREKKPLPALLPYLSAAIAHHTAKEDEA